MKKESGDIKVSPEPLTAVEKRYDRFEDDMQRTLLESRTVFLTCEIALHSVERTTKELTYVSLISKEPIKVVLNSVGGDVYAGLLIHDTIRRLVHQGIEVEVEARGLAASMGCIILQAGSKRTASKATRLMFHEISTWTFGEVTKVEDRAEELRKLNDSLRDIIARRTGQKKETIDELCKKKDTWFSAEEALEFGLVDEIIED